MYIIRSNVYSNESKNSHSHAGRTHSNAKTNIVSAKRSAVPEVHSDQMRKECKGYILISFQLQKASTIICNAA